MNYARDKFYIFILIYSSNNKPVRYLLSHGDAASWRHHAASKQTLSAGEKSCEVFHYRFSQQLLENKVTFHEVQFLVR